MKVLLTTGGTGGHIFPALQLGLELKRRGHTVTFAGALSMSLEKIRALGFEVTVIEAKGFTEKSVSGAIRFIVTMVNAISLAIKEIKRVKPDKVIGFGGYGSFAIVLAAWIKGYPTMLHEQNVVPGKANRILGKIVTKVAVSFRQTLPDFGSKAAWTGCPCNNNTVDRAIIEVKKDLGLSPDIKVIVLLGGSQGSKFLNETFFKAVQKILLEQKVAVLQVTGKTECAFYQEKYAAAGLAVVVKDFVSPIEEVYTIADVVISRAGAATVTELGLWGIRSVLVPYPFAHGHQSYNAQVLVEAGTARMIEQKDLTGDSLAEAIKDCLIHKDSRDELLRKNSGFFVREAQKRLADAVENL